MNYISFKAILLLFGLTISVSIINNSYSDVNSEKSYSQSLVSTTTAKNLAEELQTNRSSNAATKRNKSVTQQLVGSWTAVKTDNSSNQSSSTIVYSSDGTYFYIVTMNNGDWFIHNQGTWQVTDNILYENPQTGEPMEGSVKFRANDEFWYKSDNGITKWKKSRMNNNLSAEQLVGNWYIVLQQRIGNSLTADILQRQILKQIELNSDGTFRYKSSDARFLIPLSDIKIIRLSGTWEYFNFGYADGLLILKNSQGKVFSVSSINWSSNSNFINIHRSEYNRAANTYSAGKIEEFKPSNSKID